MIAFWKYEEWSKIIFIDLWKNQRLCEIFSIEQSFEQGRTQGGWGIGEKSPLGLDILQKLCCLRKGV